VFFRHTAEDGRLTFLTNKLFESDLSDPEAFSNVNEGDPMAASDENPTDPMQPSNGEFCVDMKFRYFHKMESGRAMYASDVHNLPDAG
jgi:hypothetical protein